MSAKLCKEANIACRIMQLCRNVRHVSDCETVLFHYIENHYRPMFLSRVSEGNDMTHCKTPCANCTCGLSKEAANANFAPRKRPEVITRKTFEDAAKSIAVRYKGSLDLLA